MFALTCMHCLPGGEIGDEVVVPSTMEATGVLARIIQYTNYRPPRADGHSFAINDDKDTLASYILENFDLTDVEEGSGVTIRFPDGSERTVVASGRVFGKIATGRLEHAFCDLYEWNTKLEALGEEPFPIDDASNTLKGVGLLDWALIEVEQDR